MKASGVYTVHVVAANTNFVNRASAKYDIRVVPDQPPHIELRHRPITVYSGRRT